MEDEDGKVKDAYSISSGLDYPGIGPEHAYFNKIGRVKYDSITDKEAIEALDIRLTEVETHIDALQEQFDNLPDISPIDETWLSETLATIYNEMFNPGVMIPLGFRIADANLQFVYDETLYNDPTVYIDDDGFLMFESDDEALIDEISKYSFSIENI